MSEPDGYRLNPVREARSRDERVRTGELAGAVGDARSSAERHAHAIRIVEDAVGALEAARRAHTALLATSTTSAALTRAERFVARRRHELDAALAARLRTEVAHQGQLAAVDTARGQLGSARARREVIERHFAHWRTEQRKLAERREE